MSAGVVGHCHECNLPMGSRQRHKQLGLVQHFGRGYCKHCYVRVVIRAPLARETRRPELPPTPAWMLSAPCSSSDPDSFYAEKGQSDVTASAKKICGLCRYKAVCLTYAIENDERHGVWGGKTPAERQDLDLFAEDAA